MSTPASGPDHEESDAQDPYGQGPAQRDPSRRGPQPPDPYQQGPQPPDPYQQGPQQPYQQPAPYQQSPYQQPDPYQAPYPRAPHGPDGLGPGGYNQGGYNQGGNGQGGNGPGAYGPGGYNQGAYGPGPYGQPYAPQKSRVIAGVLGILLGSLGVHRFYLGFTTIGVIQLLMSTVGAALTFGLSAIAAGIWGLVEGIMILVGSEQFRRDARGIPLRD